jgi:hypothetical protein
MTRFCPVLGNAYPFQEGFCSSCGTALSKKLEVIDLDTILSPIAALPSVQDCAMHLLALLASRTVARSAVLAANIRAQKGSTPSARQLALSTRSCKTVTRVSHRTMVSLFVINYYFKSYQDEINDI